MKSQKYIYWASTGLFTVMMLFSAGMYIFNHAEIVQAFEKLGHGLKRKVIGYASIDIDGL